MPQPQSTNADPDASAPADDARRRLDELRERLLARPHDPSALIEAGSILRDMGRDEEACAHLSRVLLRVADGGGGPDPSADDCGDPDGMVRLHHDALRRIADCRAVGRDDLAERYYRAASCLDPASGRPYVGLATLALQAGELVEAERLFQTARRLDPSRGEAHAGLAMIHERRGEHRAAFEMYLRCLELDSDNLLALLGLFQASCRMGSFSRIIRYLEAYLERHPDDTGVLFCLASLYAREGRRGHARRAALRVLAHDPEMVEAGQLLAELDGALAAGREAAG